MWGAGQDLPPVFARSAPAAAVATAGVAARLHLALYAGDVVVALDAEQRDRGAIHASRRTTIC